MLQAKNLTIKQADGYTTIIYPRYSEAKKLLGSVVIMHGMCEHHKRYLHFANFLNEQGFDVYLYDHRGHGRDKKLEELGYIADKNGYVLLIRDGIEVLEYVQKTKRTEQMIVVAHSMGSLICRNIIQYYDKMDKVIFIGTANPPLIMDTLGLLISSFIQKVKGPKHNSKFLHKLIFGNNTYRKLCERTSVDWLTRNNSIIGSYINDPFCGFPSSTSFLRDIIHLTYYASQPKRTIKTRKNLPILFISGTKDPVGNNGKDVTRLFNQFQRQTFQFVDCVLFEDCRHELLNELNKEEIMHDIVSWIKK